MVYIEILAIIFTIWSVYLCIIKNIHNWTVGIVANILYFIIFISNNLYGDSFLQIFFIIQSIVGFLVWKGYNFSIKRLPKQAEIVIAFDLTIIVYLLLNSTNDPHPILDTFVTCGSIFATYLLYNKRISAWIYWIAVDIVSIYLYHLRDLQMTMWLYVGLLGMATYGLIKWKYNKN